MVSVNFAPDCVRISQPTQHLAQEYSQRKIAREAGIIRIVAVFPVAATHLLQLTQIALLLLQESIKGIYLPNNLFLFLAELVNPTH